MDSIERKSKPHPVDTTNILSKISFWWTLDILKKGYRKTYDINDVYDPLKCNDCSQLGDQLEKAWNHQLSRGTRNFMRAILFTFWKGYLKTTVIALFDILIWVAIPLVLGIFLDSFSSESTSALATSLAYGLSLVGLDFLRHFLQTHMYFTGFHACGQINSAACSLIYRKAIRLSKATVNEASPGMIVNLIANEVNRFQFMVTNVVHVLSTPLCILIMAGITYSTDGLAGLLGLFLVLKISALQVVTGTISVRYRQKAMAKAEERIRLIDEMISGVQVMKMYTWEKLFTSRAKRVKVAEVRLAKLALHFRNLFWTYNLFIPRIGIYVALMATIESGGKPTSQNVFVMLAFFFMMNEKLLLCYKGIGEFKGSMAAARRIQEFLLLDEQRPQRASADNLEQNMIYEYVKRAFEARDKRKSVEVIARNEFPIVLDDLSVSWNGESSKNVLERVNLKFQRGKLYIIIGEVGSGKTSLLSAILKEIKVTRGSVQIEGRLSYAGQDAWIFGDTIRQNILFGEPYEQQRYERVVKACCLTEDLQQFPKGDRSVVGEKGISLSGGQKARINLARAIYRQADVYLLDDPLSAVDAHVSKRLFGGCVQKFLDGKTRLLATHQLQYVRDVDGIVLVDEGTTHFYDSCDELLKEHAGYRELIAVEETKISTTTFNRSMTATEDDPMMSFRSIPEDDSTRGLDDVIEKSSRINGAGNLLIKYFRAGVNWCLILFTVSLFIATQAFVCLNDIFVLIFKNAEETRYRENHPTNDTHHRRPPSHEHLYPTEIYVATAVTLVLCILVAGLVRTLVFDALCMRGCKSLHNSALQALVGTKLRFFHANPSGRILNRFSKDIAIIQDSLPIALIDAVQIFTMVAGALVVICVVAPIFVLPSVLVSVLCYLLREKFLNSCAPLSRLEGTVRALTLTHLNETLNGIATVRAFENEKLLIREFDRHQDLQFSTWYDFAACKFAFTVALKTLSNVFIFIITVFFVFFKDDFQGGEVGLAITQVFTMTGLMSYGSAVSADAANHLKAVERLLEYAELPSESEQQQRQSGVVDVPSKDWPENGEIEFSDVSLRYSPDEDPVLKSLNIRIRPRQKIGIVGRTGAGKSSLIIALFRLAEIDGIIKIDGIDTGSIALTVLRSRISIIPQDPVLFSGTLRQNLDPFDEYHDDDLWSALEQVELKKTVGLESLGLDCKVQDKGANYSIGQRQLICLARAILKKNRVLVLDEATANVDPRTDLLIQETIRTKFKGCTVLTVAHRLNTIIDSDKVIVMDNGCLVEFDHPYELLQMENGYFTKLVKEAGEAAYQQLLQFAKFAYNNKKIAMK